MAISVFEPCQPYCGKSICNKNFNRNADKMYIRKTYDVTKVFDYATILTSTVYQNDTHLLCLSVNERKCSLLKQQS